jgi:hypothetical protein
MDRLAEQVVAWHNRHPLAKRISIYDVHTIGVVALPFMRSGSRAVPAGPIEPAMTDEPVEDAAPPAPTPSPPPLASPPPKPPWWQALTPLLAGLRLAPAAEAAWPLFSERFINKLSPRQIARFALRHGHSTPPGEPDWPQRDVPIDEALMARSAAKASGAWPFEMYLMSAGIDAGASRTRVLLAQGAGGRMEVLGRRCLNPLPVLLLAGLLLAAAGLASWALLPGKPDKTSTEAATPAASAVPPASVPVAQPPAASAAAAASAATPGLSASEPAATSPAMPIPAEEASAPAPDIRPQLVPQLRVGAASSPPLMAAASAPARASDALAVELNRKPASAPTEARTETKTEPNRIGNSAGLPTLSGRVDTPIKAGAAPGGKQVALVSPALAGKAEAEAMLERMRGMLGQTVRDPSALQAQVFQTHEGWRAAIWPFGSREEAQLINATLIARGLRTKAVDF